MAGPRFSILPIEVLKDRRLNARDLRVLVALHAFKNRDGRCWPSRDLLAALTGLPASRISTVTTRLAALGWLSKEGNGGRSRACRYRMRIPLTITTAETVSDPVTVAGSVTKTATETVTKTLTESAPGIEQTMNEPENQPLHVAEPSGEYRANGSFPESFERFWAAYPKKRNKGDAWKAWRTIKPVEQLVDAILRAIERGKTSAQWRKDAGQFVPYPASWLRARAWEDEERVDVAPLPEVPRGERSRISSSVNALKTLFGDHDGKEIVPTGHGLSRRGVRG